MFAAGVDELFFGVRCRLAQLWDRRVVVTIAVLMVVAVSRRLQRDFLRGQAILQLKPAGE
jgi:hypothetical protein